MWLKGVDQRGVMQGDETIRIGAQNRMMTGMTPQGDIVAAQMKQCGILPVIGVRMRQKHGMDGRPREAGRSQACAELSRPQADIDEYTEAVRFHQAGIASASAGEYRETQTNLSLAKTRLVNSPIVNQIERRTKVRRN